MLFRHGAWRCAKVPNFRARNRHFAQGPQVSGMADYTNDMHLAGLQIVVGQRLYAERYTTKNIHHFFAQEVS